MGRLFDGAAEELRILPLAWSGNTEFAGSMTDELDVMVAVIVPDPVSVAVGSPTDLPDSAVGVMQAEVVLFFTGAATDLPDSAAALFNEPEILAVQTFDGASAILGPYYVGPPLGGTFDILTFDGATPIPGPKLLTVVTVPVPVSPTYPSGLASFTVPVRPPGDFGPPPGPFQPQMWAELWSRDGEYISGLGTQSGVRFQDTLSDTGSGSLAIQLDDAEAALLKPGTEIRCFLFGELVFTWEVLQNPRISLIGAGEESAQTKQASGRGRASLLDRAKVYPVRGTTNTVNAQHRLYTFASPDFPNASTWGNAFEIVRSGTLYDLRAVPIEYTVTDLVTQETAVVETVLVPAPNGWPVPDAMWIWGQADTEVVGKCYFRKEFFIGSEINIAIIASGDNYFTLYLDGTPIIGENELMHSWKDYKRVDLLLTAGWHTFGMIGENTPWPPEYANPSAILAAITALDADGKVITPAIIQTDATWTTLAYPAVPPGWTPGQTMIDAIDEAQARGALPGFMIDFTALNDSLGNPWPFMEGFSTSVGSSILDMLTGLTSQGWVDWRVKPGGKVLQMFNQGVIATNSGITYQPTGDLATQEVVSQDFVPQVDIINRYLVKWTGGYFEIEDPVSQALWGKYEGFASIDAPSIDDAMSQATVVLAESANPIYAIVLQVDPTSQDRYPYEAYGVGEKVQVLDPDGNLNWFQVHSITVSQTDLARCEIAFELNARLNTRQREDFELLQGIGRGVVGDTKWRNQRMTTSDGKRR